MLLAAFQNVPMLFHLSRSLIMQVLSQTNSIPSSLMFERRALPLSKKLREFKSLSRTHTHRTVLSFERIETRAPREIKRFSGANQILTFARVRSQNERRVIVLRARSLRVVLLIDILIKAVAGRAAIGSAPRKRKSEKMEFA